MMELRTMTCRGCGEQIAFIKTERGKFLPVNTESVSFVPAGGPNTYVMSDGTVKTTTVSSPRTTRRGIAISESRAGVMRP